MPPQPTESGRVAPAEAPDYYMELHKRAERMNPEQHREFYQKVIDTADKNTANMTMESFGKRMGAIRMAIRTRVAKMTRAQFKASGLRLDGRFPDSPDEVAMSCHHRMPPPPDGDWQPRDHRHHGDRRSHNNLEKH
ncbi:DUF1104 domain-containing protein [Helicobacter bizzozeronii]|uniref:DUF1104 domain-containing protein n=1 Tax=Helicobacter bizzozeronii TaxID=56877 RepID=UPI002278CB4F|nr:DUF1104 domain-containing protein [Helicobacter bizzozeronii]